MGACEVRGYVPSDETALVDLLNRVAVLEGGNRTSAREWRALLALWGSDAGSDVAVALWEGYPAGCAVVGRKESSTEEFFPTEGVVLPEYRRRGIGTALMKRLIARAAACRRAYDRPSRVGMRSSSRRPGTAELAQSLGFWRLTSAFWMERGTEGLPQVAAPRAFRFRRFERDRDERPFVHLFNRSFADHFPPNQLTLESLESWLRSGIMEPEGTVLAVVKDGWAKGAGAAGDSEGAVWSEAGEGMVGFCTTSFHAEGDQDGRPVGEVATLGVVPEFRRRGLGRTLLVLGLASLRDRGAVRAGLRVMAGNQAARTLYASIGFEEAYREVLWRLDLG
ncbi:MAG: GNAT family N-acetyltransferase [Acetobacteraceae bacterium]|nr:GNAT family N-acetyltransferase [Acetobacteraceae bacterium]